MAHFRQFADRWFRPLAALGFVLLGILIYSPALGDERLLYGRDTIFHDYTMHLYGWGRILNDGQWPLWSPELFLGLPFIGSFALCPFYPTQWLYFLLPFNTAFTLQYALALAVGGLGTAWWARRLGTGRLVALWAGVAFIASGHFLTLTHAGHLQKMIAIAWAPAAFAAVQGFRSKRQSDKEITHCLAAAIALGMQLLASHPQIFYATVAGCGALVLVQPTAHRFARLGFFGLAVALALALSAIQMFPALETAAISNRAQGVSFAEAVETSYPPAETLEYVIPSVYGDSLGDSPAGYFGAWGERIVSDFVGAPLVLLALLGVVAGGASRRVRLFLLLMGAVALVIGFGRYTPLYGWLYALLPGWKSFRSPGTFMFLTDLALVILAALGLQRLVDGWRSLAMDSSFTGRWARLVPAALLGLAVAGTIAAVAAWTGAEVPATPDAVRRQQQLRGVMILGFQLASGALLMAAAIWRSHRTASRSASGQWSVAALALFALAVMAGHNARYIKFDPLQPFLRYLRHPVYEAANRAAPATEEGSRAASVRLLEENALLTAGMISGVGTPAGYHPVMLRRYESLMKTLDPASEVFGDLMNVHLARTSRAEAAPQVDPDGRRWELLGRYGSQPPAFLWKRSDTPLPLVRSAAGLVKAGSREEAARLLRKSATLALHTPVIEPEMMKLTGLNSGTVATTSATLTSWSPHRIAAALQPSTGGNYALITLSEVAAPGWRAATDDGREVPVLAVNVAQRAVLIPPKTSSFTMEYAPWSLRIGVFVTLLSAAVAGAVGMTNRRRGGPAR